MKILIAPDSFKDALPALQVCEAIRQGVQKALPNVETQVFPLSDGGEGVVEVLAFHLGGHIVEVEVNDPLFRPVTARFFRHDKTAYLEMAQTSGLQLLSLPERNPLKTSTFGTGEMIAEAIRGGAKDLFLAIGGSATNDAGMGMAAALGWRFLSEDRNELQPIGENLIKVEKIEPPSGYLQPFSLDKLGLNPPLNVLCDVVNPLYGPNGAAHVFAKQKGADELAIKLLDTGLQHFSAIVEQTIKKDHAFVPGAGAAGGLGFGAMSFLSASLLPGATSILNLVGFEKALKNADLVITGEGRLDGQTASGKLVATVCKAARQFDIPVFAICGEVVATAAEQQTIGLEKAVQLRKQGESLASSISNTKASLTEAAYHIFKTWRLMTDCS